MRPYLKGGNPIRQVNDELGTVLKLCKCWDCHDHTSIHPLTGSPLKGRLVGRKEYAIHQAQENVRGIASPSDLPLPPSSALDFSCPQSQPIAIPSIIPIKSNPSQLPSRTPTTLSPVGAVSAVTSNDHDDGSAPAPGILQSLQLLELDIKRSTSNFASVTHDLDLQFCDPPSLTSPIPSRITEVESEVNSGALALKSQSRINSEILNAEECLYNALTSTEKAMKHANVRVRLKATVIRNAAQGKMVALYAIKHDEWMRQRGALGRAGVSKPLVPVEVRTGMFHMCFSY